MYVIICYGDERKPFGYRLATRKLFNTRAAAERYAVRRLKQTLEPEILPVSEYLVRFENWTLAK